jgi:hypothetical protein
MTFSSSGACSPSGSPAMFLIFWMDVGVGRCSCTHVEFVWDENEREGRNPDEDGPSAMFELANTPPQLSESRSTTRDLQDMASALEILVLSIPMSIRDRTWFRSLGLRPSNHIGLARARSEGTTCFGLLRAILKKLKQIRQYIEV